MHAPTSLSRSPLARTVLLVGVVVLLGGCSLFRASPERAPQALTPTDVADGIPTSLPSDFPLPAARNNDRTYHRPGKNVVFFSATESPGAIRAELERSLPEAGYTIRGVQEQSDGGVIIHFLRDGKLGYASIFPKVPARYDARMQLDGTFVEITYELTPPPIPVLPRS